MTAPVNPRRTEVVVLSMANTVRAVFYSVVEAEEFLLENGLLGLDYELATTKLLHSDLSTPTTTDLTRD